MKRKRQVVFCIIISVVCATVVNAAAPASGGFYCRVAYSEDFTSGPRVIMDMQDGVTKIRSTADTASAVGVLTHAAMIYSAFDPAFAQDCSDAAIDGWAFLVLNPNNIQMMARASINRIPGANPMRKSFVSGYVDDCIQHIFATWSEDGLPGIQDGFFGRYVHQPSVPESGTPS